MGGVILGDQRHVALRHAEVIASPEPGAIGEDRRHPRLLRGEVDRPPGTGRRALEADIGDEVGEPVGARDQRRGHQPALAVERPERFAEVAVDLEPRRGETDPALRAGEASRGQRPRDMRPPRLDRHGHRSIHRNQFAFARGKPRAGGGKPPLEASGQIALSGNGEAQRPERRPQCDRRIGDIDRDVWELERRFRRARLGQQLVDLAPADSVSDQLTAQPHAPRDDPIHFDLAGQ